MYNFLNLNFNEYKNSINKIYSSFYIFPENVVLNEINNLDREIEICRNIEYKENWKGRGIVISCGRNHYYLLYIQLNILKDLNINLPIEIWSYPDEIDNDIKNKFLSYFNSLNIEFRECLDIKFICHRFRGWMIKNYAMFYSKFEEVIQLDVDSFPLVNPENLFELEEYKKYKCIFWNDGKLYYFNNNIIGGLSFSHKSQIWKFSNVEYNDNFPTLEVGQVYINKKYHYLPMLLSLYIIKRSDFYFHIFFGDKDIFNIIFHRINIPFEYLNICYIKLIGGLAFVKDICNKYFLHFAGINKYTKYFKTRHRNCNINDSFLLKRLDIFYNYFNEFDKFFNIKNIKTYFLKL